MTQFDNWFNKQLALARSNNNNAKVQWLKDYKEFLRIGYEAALSELKSIEPVAKQTPFDNCQFEICDLPGQCKGEGKCHHPKYLTQPQDKEITALKAHVNKLREALSASAKIIAIGDDDYELRKNTLNEINESLSTTATQSLAEHDAEVIDRLIENGQLLKILVDKGFFQITNSKGG